MKGLIAILLVLVFIPSCKDLKSNDLPFDSERWKAGDVRLRGRMTISLYAQEELIIIGKTQAEVKEILGEPGLIYRDPCCRDASIGDTYRYDIDFGMISERWLSRNAIYIIFDTETGKAVKLDGGDY
jgi:hypothetical protein